MKKFLLALILLCLPISAQAPYADYKTYYNGCGWFTINPHLMVTHPPIIGKYLELTPMAWPPYGLDFLVWGWFDPHWNMIHPTAIGCQMRVWPFNVEHFQSRMARRYLIPNDSTLAGLKLAVQQVNMNTWGYVPAGPNGPATILETGKAVLLTLGY